jgi:3-hydroxymyristoyl/3-hydroxydecanoyl-(acyl carrier protein) dehydratase
MRYILLDRITTFDVPNRAVGVKCVSLSDDIFADHFPTMPIFPGALVVEALAQLAGALLEAASHEKGHENLYSVLAKVGPATFKRMVHPGDRLDLEARAAALSGSGGRFEAAARVDGEIVTETELTFFLAPVTNPALIAHRRHLLDVWLGRHRS